MEKIYQLSIDYENYRSYSQDTHTVELYSSFEKGLIYFIKEVLISFSNNNLLCLLFPDKKIPENLKNLVEENKYGFVLSDLVYKEINIEKFIDSFKKLNEDINNNFLVLREKVEKNYNDVEATNLVLNEFNFNINYKEKSAEFFIHNNSIGNIEVYLNEAEIK